MKDLLGISDSHSAPNEAYQVTAANTSHASCDLLTHLARRITGVAEFWR
jgi:hypothetical protein